jgi:MFS family permease
VNPTPPPRLPQSHPFPFMVNPRHLTRPKSQPAMSARAKSAYVTPLEHITTAITLTLLFRSLGALLFGVLADRFGRKWTLVANLCLIAVFELGSGFVNTYSQFLAVRSLFGMFQGAAKVSPDELTKRKGSRWAEFGGKRLRRE